jgi:hypothetical protein
MFWEQARSLLTYCSKQYRDLVTLVIGSAKKDYTVHKDLLIFYSDYFRAAFDGSFVEATERKMDLFDVKEQTFEDFHTWLYTRKLASEDDEPLTWRDLIDFWIFGDRFQVSMLQNCVMDEIFAKDNRGECFPLRMLKFSYGNTMTGSLLRKAMIELMVYETDLGGEDEGTMKTNNTHYYTVEILQDLVEELYFARQNKIAFNKRPKRDKCLFHVHGKDEHC